MLPLSGVGFSPSIPSGARFYSADEVDELRGVESLGYFHDTWSMGEISLNDARTLVAREMELITLVDHASSNPESFEMITTAIEHGDPSYLPQAGSIMQLARVRELIDDFDEVEPYLDELELGVAGLTYTLNAAGFVTVASCRSHVTPQSWAPAPVVCSQPTEYGLKRSRL